MASAVAMSPDILITIKLQVGSENRRFKLPLRDLGATSFPEKLRTLLALPPTQTVVFERYSDSAGQYITLDSSNPSVYKQLYRAAKAKLKLRIKATISEVGAPNVQISQPAPVTPVCLTSHCYVPPMNPDSPKLNSSKALEPLILRDLSAAMTPGNPVLSPDELQRQAYAQHVRNSTSACMASHCKTLSITPEPEVEPLVAVKQEAEDEAPVPRPFSDHANFYADLASLSKSRPMHLRAIDQDFHVPAASFTVCCDNCQTTIPDAHWHCSICQDGDYDICRDCHTSGVHCGEEGHFLIKRSIENGKVISSITETVPKKPSKLELENEVPGAFTSDVKEEQVTETLEMSRTCNSCVNVFEESNFVTCMVCEDYDLCIPCHVGMKHGHHPSHNFAPVSEDSNLDTMAALLCAPGRNVRHFAICDGCDKDIYGTRHKCTNCPDWDYCSACIKNARYTHAGHRFIPIYEPIPSTSSRLQVHHGINCDGPLCQKKVVQGWIMGDRYKCAVCHDTDFCASCEALPTHRHNRTHPLIKFRTPVRNVSVTTLGEKENGEAMCSMGDKAPQTSSKSTETTPTTQSANAATQVQTVAEVKPSESIKEESIKEESIKEEQIKEESIKEESIKEESIKEESIKEESIKEEQVNEVAIKVELISEEKTKASPTTQLHAHFITDATPDGSKIRMGFPFQQVWVLRNPGPHAWPAGCSVRFVGGDNMFNVDDKHPSSTADIASATESNFINRAVDVNEEVAFWVTMKAPERTGKAISYWRLEAADGTPFGHKLWCDIDVYAPELKSIDVEKGESEHIEDNSKEDKQDEAIIVKEESAEETKEAKQSQMIFPKLDKESPVSSTHQDHQSLSPVTTTEQELLEEVESLELDDESSSDDGFLTDEEYEILNVDDDDEEAINGKK